MNSKTLWDPKMKVGSDIIDNQHKVLFDLIKDLNNAIRAGANMRILDTLLGVLLNYAFQHFEIEEEYFKNHADFTRHCLEHYEMLKKLNSFIVDFRNNRHEGDKTPSAFLENWLIGHIEQFDRPFLAHDAVSLHLMKESDQVDEFDPESKDRRLHKRIHHHDVIDGDISISCYNASRLKSGEATIVDMSLGGLKLNSTGHHEIDNLLVISCSIGANFKMKEKVQVKTVNGNMYGVEFVFPSQETIDFITKLYGAVHLSHARLS
jgi:hemerythrin-like metal-binding protein